jgi:SAM-dependent methyltransferase
MVWMGVIAKYCGMNETLELLRIALSPQGGRADLVYDALGRRNLWSQTSGYLNLGFWRHAENIDKASRDLAFVLADAADLAPGACLLDVGCGFGDQDHAWLGRCKPSAIHAINYSWTQLRDAAAAKAANLYYYRADATMLPFATASFDGVLSLEAAFHFRPRQAFFSESYRVLRTGGRIALTDFVLKATPLLPQQRLALRFGALAWQIPFQNLMPLDAYLQDLGNCGFASIKCTVLTPDVIPPFCRYMRSALDIGPLRDRYHPLVRMAAKVQIDWGFLAALEYVLVTATRR